MEFASSYVFTPQRSTHAAADDDRAEAEAGVEIGEEDLEAGLESFSSPIAAPPQAQQPPPPLMGPSGGGGFLSGIKSAMMGFGAPAMAELPSPAPAPPATASASGNGSARSAGRRKQRKTYRREADTNIISIKLGSLGEDVAVATGDPCVCVGCGAMFSSLSKVMVAGGAAWTDVLHDDASSTSPPVMQPQPADDDGDSMHLDTIAESPRGSSMAAPAMGGGDDGILGACDDAASGTSKWVCEFCGHQNVLDLEPEELPTSATMDYLVQPAPARDMEHGSELIVFAIDISGSMCVTSEIEGLEVNLRGGGPDAREVLAGTGLLSAADGPQHFRSERGRRITYISRLQAVQAAVATQIESLAKSAPNKRVAIVAFSSGLQLHGDASTDFDAAAMAVEGDHLESCDELRAAGQAAASRGGASCQAVSAASEGLIERLYTLEEGGGTALGPAICVALGMAQGVAGSKVIVCTDGLANIGVGALDELDTDAATEQATAFYAALGNEAAAQGCSIDVVALEGDGCDVENLGVMSEAAGGTVSKLDPTKLVDEFAAILAEPVLATRCTLTMHLHAGLRFRNEDELAEEAAAAAAGTSALQHHHVLVKQIGNVTASSEVSVEFGLAPQRATVGLELPFQSQLRFTRADGSVVTRVQTAIMPVTQDSALAEAQANPALLAAHAAKQTAQLGQRGDYMAARVNSFAYDGVLQRCCVEGSKQRTYSSWRGQQTSLDRRLRDEQMEESMSGIGDLDAMVERSARSGSSAELTAAKSARSFHRRKARSKKDHFSAELLQVKASKSTTY